MTITEELDKKSARPHRSKNIMDALKYAAGLKATPVNIAEGVKKGSTIKPIWHLGVRLAPKPVEPEGITNNAKVKSVVFANNTATVTVKLSDLTEYPSTVVEQGTHKWVALEIATGINPVTGLKYNNAAITTADAEEATANGCIPGALVLWLKCDEVVSTDKVFTLKADGNEDQTITIKVVEPA